MRRVPQAHRLELFQHPFQDLLLGNVSVFSQRKRHVLEDVQVGEQRTGLEQHAHPLAHGPQRFAVQAGHVLAEHVDAALLGRQLAGDGPQQRRLA